MKLHILNDLHVEFGDFTVPETDADVIIMAGDIGVGMQGLAWIEAQNPCKPVIYIPGNHEFYHHDICMIDELKAKAPDNVYVLNDTAVVLDGVRFLGSILWTDFMLFGEADKYFSVQCARKNMTDFNIIKINRKQFTPEDSIELHEKSRDWLSCMLSEPFDGKTVVVTHHAPSSKSVSPRFAKNLLTPAFASNLEELMDGSRAALWVHGHTHDGFDYDVFGTRVICNPRGYVAYEENMMFNPELVVEI